MAAKEEDSKLTSLSEIFSKSLQFVDKIDDSHNAVWKCANVNSWHYRHPLE